MNPFYVQAGLLKTSFDNSTLRSVTGQVVVIGQKKAITGSCSFEQQGLVFTHGCEIVSGTIFMLFIHTCSER